MIYSPMEQFEISYFFFFNNSIILFGLCFLIFLIQIILLLAYFTPLIYWSDILKKKKSLGKKKFLLFTPGILFNWWYYYLSNLTIFIRQQGIASYEEKFLLLIPFYGIFILFSNIIGLFPFAISLSTHIITTFTLASLFFLSINFLGIHLYREIMFNLFVPAGSPKSIIPIIIPIEIISYIARVFSLSIRLFANIVSSHILLKILATFTVKKYLLGGLFNFLIFFIMHLFFLLDLFVSILQAYTFVTLCILYLKDVLYANQH